MSLQEVLQKLNGVKKSQNGFIAKCPAHKDDHQSLHLYDSGQRVLINCFAGCSPDQVIKSAGVEWKHLFQDDHRKTKPKSIDGVTVFASATSKIRAIYRYTAENGELLYENVRYEPKTFRQRHFDGSGGIIWNLEGVRRVPYRLPELLPCISRGADLFA